MISAMLAASSKDGKGGFSKVDLGNGHVGLSGGLTDASTGVAAGTTDLFLSDRYAIITMILPSSSDAASIALAMGKAFSSVADNLPPAPQL